MLRGFYNAAQSMIVKQRELDAATNNLANINTAGYRKEEVVLNTFQEELILVRNRRETSGKFVQTYADSTKANLEQSNFEFTESKFDVAIWGNVYFNIASPGQTGQPVKPTDREETYKGGIDPATYLTRNGQFELDNEGYLTLNKAGRVQGLGGDIQIGTDDFIIDADGVIYNTTDYANWTVIDTLQLTYVPPDADVAKVGNNLFTYNGGEALPADETFDVVQGAFEKSNVDANKEITKMMEFQRHYEASSTALKYLDQMNATSARLASLSKG